MNVCSSGRLKAQTYPAELNLAHPDEGPSKRPFMTKSVTRVLVVDPNIGSAIRLSVHLQSLGLHVATAFTLVSAESVASEFRPDVVIADDQYGEARLQSLRAVFLGTQACEPDARFICLVQTLAAGRSLVDSGFDSSWLKPVEHQDLVGALQTSLAAA